MPKEYIERDELLERFERYSSSFLVEDDYDTALTIIHGAPIDDELVEVVRCADCDIHGSCLTEDTFKIARIKDPYCCAGKRKDGAE